MSYNYGIDQNYYDYNEYNSQSNNKGNNIEKYNQYNYENGGNNYNNYNDSSKNLRLKGNNNPIKINIEEAMLKSSYPKYTKDFVKDFIINNYYNHQTAKVYLTSVDSERIFVAEYSLPILCNGKTYKVYVLVYFPLLYPDYPPEFYISKKGNVGIPEYYAKGKIGQTNLRIFIEYFVSFDPLRNNVEEIIQALIKEFNKQFPVFKRKMEEKDDIQKGKCIFKRDLANEVILEKNMACNNNKNNFDDIKFNSNNNYEANNNININNNNLINKNKNDFDDNSILDFMRVQTKDKVREKYMNFTEQFNNINKNHNDLENIKDSLTISSNKDNTTLQLNKEIEKLRKIRDNLKYKEKLLVQENQQLERDKGKNVFDKCNELIRVNNEKYFEYTVQIKTIKDYLIFLKKGYEKKLISLEEAIKKTRMLSRELFTIYYIRDKMNNNSL
jgi:hypothetical protein